MTKKELAKKIYEVSHLEGDFLLRSGQKSSEYFDKYRFESQPELLREIAFQLSKILPPSTEYLGGLEMGGVPIATALSLQTGIPVIFIRKKAKTYGTCRFAEGAEITNKRICLIEDVITTGGQVVLSTQDLRSEGAIVDSVLCVIYRGEGEEPKLKEIFLKHISLFTMMELKQAGLNF